MTPGYGNLGNAGARVRRHYGIAAIFICITALLPAFIAAAGLGDSKLLLRNRPDDIAVYINGLSRQPDDTGGIPLTPGPVLFEIKQQRVVVFSTLFLVDSAEEKTIVFNCTSGCALLHVITEPQGATLSMNGAILGTTPYMNRFMNPGEHSIMATYPGRIPIVRRIGLVVDSSPVFSFTMEQTQAVRDSIATVKRAFKMKRQMIQGIGFGGLGIGLAIAGAWFDHSALRHIQNAKTASESYNLARTDQSCQEFKAQYRKERSDADKPIVYRNICYAVAGVCLAGFYVAFVF